MNILVSFLLSGLTAVLLFPLIAYIITYIKNISSITNFLHTAPKILLYISFIFFFCVALYFVVIGKIEFENNGFCFHAILDALLASSFFVVALIIA